MRWHVCGNGADYVTGVTGRSTSRRARRRRSSACRSSTAPAVEGVRGLHLQPGHGAQRRDLAGEQPDQHRRQRHDRAPRRVCSCATRSSTRRTATRSCRCLLGGPAGQTSNSTVTVHYATANGTATAGADYSAASGTLSFAPGETAKTVVVPIMDDGDAEGPEGFVPQPEQPRTTPTSPTAPGRSRSARATRPIRPTRTFARPPTWSSVRRRVHRPAGHPVRAEPEPGRQSSTRRSTARPSPAPSAATAPTTSPSQGRSTSRRGRRPRSFACRSSTARLVERPFEAFTFNLDTEHNGVISRASSRISIVDNDTIVPTPQLFVRDAVVDEKDGNALVLGACWAAPQARPRTAPSPSTTRPRSGSASGAATTPPPAARSPSRPGRRPRPWSSRSPTTVPTSRRKASRSLSATPSTPRSPRHRDGHDRRERRCRGLAARNLRAVRCRSGRGRRLRRFDGAPLRAGPEHGVGHATRLITQPPSPAPSAATAPTTSPPQGRSTSRRGRRRRSFAWRSSIVPISRIPRHSRSI